MLSRFARDLRGVSAVEFALIAPILISFYFGMAELTTALMAERRASHAASAIGDLVAQSRVVSGDDVDDIFEIGDRIVSPFPADTLKSCVVSIAADKDGNTTVLWSKANRGFAGCPDEGDPIAVPDNLIDANQGLVQARVEYSYASPINYVLPHPVVFKERFYLRPRQSETVALDED